MSKKNENTSEQPSDDISVIRGTVKDREVCGIVMPISSIDGCEEAHWEDVLSIIQDAISDAGYEPNLVSNAEEVGIIQKRIIQNLYENPIVVCDVSGKNPNVMFELGMRLAFDKPTIIVKDDKTNYSFDTAPIEHLEYPRDLRFGQIVEFKKNLSNKIIKTVEIHNSDKNYTTFLKHFGDFKVVKIESKEVSKEDYIIEEIKSLKSIIIRQSKSGEGYGLYPKTEAWSKRRSSKNEIDICAKGWSKSEIDAVGSRISMEDGVKGVSLETWRGHKHLLVEIYPSIKVPQEYIINRAEEIRSSVSKN